MFRAANILLVTKSDLLPVLEDFSPESVELNLRNIASTVPIIELSARKNLGLQTWFDWLTSELVQQRARINRGESAHPKIQPDGMHLHMRAT
jgi:hydrogenase nickel incorporation protein HypB